MKYQLQRFKCWIINNTIPILYAIGAVEIMWAYIRDSITLSIMGAMFIFTGLTFLLYEGIDALRPEEKPVKTKITAPKPHEPTDEELKYEKILANIDNYNGTPERQVKV